MKIPKLGATPAHFRQPMNSQMQRQFQYGDETIKIRKSNKK